MLYIVPTPIGNLKDITLRALETLKNAGLILCEDTRTSGVLLKHYDIHTPLKSYHQFNEHQVTAEIVNRLQDNSNLHIAIITDAGTPAISDPGFLLVRECIEAGIEVECLPGATAVIPALVQSGLPCDRFVFEGFLPRQKGRQTKIKQLAQEERTFAFYESPYRLVKTLQQLSEMLDPLRKAAVCREISKLHSETRRGTLKELATYYEQHKPKGEIAVIVNGQLS
ncbi:MAG: 16S rRNA (cytidine(1402)-2'-O)-methyltransferase [Bacteroidales bacterium]|jgi:16S rRNA (cytidine1402-2'-O)-methyltransferase|nr:16S rRNA (cytidine(1402)-2'-O)-methyltransferase [Bacteroidales bacterium]